MRHTLLVSIHVLSHTSARTHTRPSSVCVYVHISAPPGHLSVTTSGCMCPDSHASRALPARTARNQRRSGAKHTRSPGSQAAGEGKWRPGLSPQIYPVSSNAPLGGSSPTLSTRDSGPFTDKPWIHTAGSQMELNLSSLVLPPVFPLQSQPFQSCPKKPTTAREGASHGILSPRRGLPFPGQGQQRKGKNRRLELDRQKAEKKGGSRGGEGDSAGKDRAARTDRREGQKLAPGGKWRSRCPVH